ncbi:MAG TPA: hypothetical protein VF600_11130 [Abditibacteriaceae bacterium]|jgi:anthranilate phosphoribosyltransferase
MGAFIVTEIVCQITIAEGLKLARASANSSAAREKLAQLIEYSNRA